MVAIDAMKRSVWLLAFVVTVLAACSRGSSSAGAGSGSVAAPTTAMGVYAVEGTEGEYLVLEEDGRFCFREQGMVMLGTYEVDGTSLTLTPDQDEFGPQTGTIEGDVVTDPDGVEWVRSTEIDPASCDDGTDGSEPPSLMPELPDTIAGTAWPREVDEATRALRRLPRAIDGYRMNPAHPVAVGSGTVSATFPDPNYPGPVSGVSILVIRVPRSLTAAQLVDATAHLGFGLRDETKRLDPDEPVPLVVAEIVEVEGAGKLPAGHSGYLAIWSTRGGPAAFAVIADGLRSLTDGLAAVSAAVKI